MPDIDPQALIIFLMMIFAGAKALFEKIAESRRKEQRPPIQFEEEEEEDYGVDLYQQQLERVRKEYDLVSPPPLPTAPIEAPVILPTRQPPALELPPKPVLSKAEKEALANLQNRSAQKPSQKKSSFLTTKSRLKTHLSSPTAAREALLLSEVFGPPKALEKN